MNVIRTQPALITAVVTAVLVLVTAFGVPISEDQHAAVVGVTGAVLALLAGVTTRALVTPTVAPKANDGTPLVPASTEAGGTELPGPARVVIDDSDGARSRGTPPGPPPPDNNT